MYLQRLFCRIFGCKILPFYQYFLKASKMRASAVSLLSIYFLISICCSKKDTEEIKPTVGDVTQSVYASGVVKAVVTHYLVTLTRHFFL